MFARGIRYVRASLTSNEIVNQLCTLQHKQVGLRAERLHSSSRELRLKKSSISYNLVGIQEFAEPNLS